MTCRKSQDSWAGPGRFSLGPRIRCCSFPWRPAEKRPSRARRLPPPLPSLSPLRRTVTDYLELTGQHPGLQDGATGCAGCRISGQGLLSGRATREKGATPLPHPAEHVPGQPAAGRGRDSAAKGPTGLCPNPIGPLLQPVAAEGRRPNRCGQLAVSKGFGPGQPAVRRSQTGPGQTRPELHGGQGSLLAAGSIAGWQDPGNLVGAGESTVLAEVNQIDPHLRLLQRSAMLDLARLIGEAHWTPGQAREVKMAGSCGST